jgi:polysaccharide deacetylase 2 family uncharacterized protein YibQ
MRWRSERNSSGKGGWGKSARSPLMTFWAPFVLLVLQGTAVLALVGWLVLKAEDTKARRALRVPYAIAEFDLAKPIADAEFEAYRRASEGEEETAASLPPAPEKFETVTFQNSPSPPPLKNDLRAPPVDSNLIEVSPFGPLPVIAPDDRAPWQVYSQPVDQKKIKAAKGVIAIIVENAGLSEPALQSFLADLPPQITFAFNPYAPELDLWIGRTRALGHEVLMGLPMEPKDFPQSDPGPRALMKSYNEKRTIEAMKWSLGRGAGYVGLMTIMGDSFTEKAWRIDPVLQEAKNRGLLFIDNSTLSGKAVTTERAGAFALPYAASGFQLDDALSQKAIEDVFAKTEAAARKGGHAVLVVSPYPVVLEMLKQWLPMLRAKKLELVPISYVAATQLEKQK